MEKQRIKANLSKTVALLLVLLFLFAAFVVGAYLSDSKTSVAYAETTTTITLDNNGGTADGSVTATSDNELPSFTALTRENYVLNGYYTSATGGTKVINADGTLVAGVANYTDSTGKWINTDSTVTLHAQWGAAFTSSWQNSANLPSGATAARVTSIKLSSSAPSGYTDSDVNYGDIDIYQKTGSSTDLAYVFAGEIKADSSCSRLFYNCTSLASIDFTNFDTSAVTDMDQMFYNCGKLTSLDLSDFDTSQVKYMNAMFYECGGLGGTFGKESTAAIKIGSNFITAAVTNMSGMFFGCGKLT